MLGVQMYGVCANSPLPLKDTLSRLASLGFDAIEPCLALDPIPGWEKTLWPLEDFHKAAQLAQELGLKIPSCHVFAANLASHVSEMNGLAEAYGINAYVVKTPPPVTAEGLIQTVSAYRDVVKQLKTAQLLLHNELEDG